MSYFQVEIPVAQGEYDDIFRTLNFLLTDEDQVQRTFYVYKVLVYCCMF